MNTSKTSGRRSESNVKELPAKSRGFNRIKKHRPATCLVGFKLETDQHPPILKKKVKQLIKDACCDLVVANTAGKTYRSCIFNNNLDILARAQDRITTSRQLANILNKTL